MYIIEIEIKEKTLAINKKYELKRLMEVKEILESYFNNMPEIEICDSDHYFMTAAWSFIVTFNNDSNMVLMFDLQTEPFIAASIARIIAINNIEFDIDRSYYYSIYDDNIYFNDEISLRQLIDREKSIMQSKEIRTRQ